MTVNNIFEHFMNLSTWIDKNNTVDTISYGNADAQVFRIGTGWSACLENLKAASRDGCDLFISHEQTFGFDGICDNIFEWKWACDRRDVLDAHNMSCITLHDSWDHFPVYGVRPSFARLLKLGNLIQELDYIHPWSKTVTTGKNSIGIYEVNPITLHSFCLNILNNIKPFGEHGIKYYGKSDTIIKKVAIGVGCHIPTFEAFEAMADALILIYDRALMMGRRIQLEESGANVILVEHSTSEVYSMKELTRYLKETFPSINVNFYNLEPRYTYISTT